MPSITRPKNKEELAKALLAVRRDLEAQGEIGAQKPTAPQPLVPPTPPIPPAHTAPTPPATPEQAAQAPTPTPTQATASAPELPQQPAAGTPHIPIETAAPSSSATDGPAPAGMRPDPYREQIEKQGTERTPVPIPRAAATPDAEEAPGVDPTLMSDEVTEGLAELLSKWDLFEKSGIFGLGPAGMQHPTYEKIAVLSVEDVLAGTWEGADEETAKTIGEYVAGWTGEQGVSPRDGETFEVYLRRVIASYLGAPEEPSEEAVA